MLKKRLTAGLLSVAMCAMQFVTPLTLNAEELGKPTVTLSSQTQVANPGDNVSIDIDLKNNPGINVLAIFLHFDKDNFEYLSFEQSNEVFTERELSHISKPNRPDPSISDYEKYAHDKINEDGLTKFGYFTNDYLNRDGDGHLLTVNFKVKDTAKNGQYDFSLSSSSGNIVNEDYEDLYSQATLGKYTVKIEGGALDPYEGDDPTPAVLSNETSEGFDVELAENHEYTVSDKELTDFSKCEWSEEKTVTGLEPNTTYYVYTRVKATESMAASGASTVASTTTKKLQLANIITNVSIGNDGAVGTKLEPVVTYRDGAPKDKIGAITYTWTIGDTTVVDASYTIKTEDIGKKISVTATAANCEGSVKSNELTAGKKNCKEEPTVPEFKDTTYEGFTVVNKEGYEYVISESETLPEDAKWTKFTGDVKYSAKAGKTYYVFVRIAETEDTNASDVVSASVETPLKPTADPEIVTDNTEKLSRSAVIEIKNKDTVDADIYYTTDGTDPLESKTAKKYEGGIKISELGLAPEADTLTIKAYAVAKADDMTVSNVVEKTFEIKTSSAYLNGIKVNGTEISDFAAGTVTYKIEMAYADYDKKPVTVEGVPGKGEVTDPAAAAITVDEPEKGNGGSADFVITVTPEDGEEVTYTVTIVVKACAHEKTTETVVKAPGHFVPGVVSVVCDTCGNSVDRYLTQAAGGHTLNVTTEAATCVEDGYTYYVCSDPDCDYTKLFEEMIEETGNESLKEAYEALGLGGFPVKAERIPATGHKWGAPVISEDGKTATVSCTNEGCTETQVCDITEGTTDCDSHQFVLDAESSVAPTCSTDGKSVYKCSVCGATFETTVGQGEKKHTLGEPENFIPASCVMHGITAYICTECDDLVIFEEGSTFADHEWGEPDENGVIRCKVCNIVKTNTPVPGPDPDPTPTPTPTPQDPTPSAPSVPTGDGWHEPAAPENPESIVNAQFEDKFQIGYSNAVEGTSGKVAVSKNGSKVTASFDSSLNGMFANLYDPDGNFVSAAEIKNNKAKLNAENAAKGWTIIVDEEAHGEDVSAEAGEIVMMDNVTGKSVSYAVPAVIIALIAIAANVLIIRKRVSKK